MKYRLFVFLWLGLCSLPGLLHNVHASDLYGYNARPPAQVRSPVKVNRYRTAARPVDVNCDCNPGIYSVVYLSGNSTNLQLSDNDTTAMAQKNMRFEPSILAIEVGSTVEFPNLDPFFHNVFSYSKIKKFDLGKYPLGKTSLVTFDRPGLVKVFCEIHSSMRAYVHVLETPYFTVSDKNGNFRIGDVAPGEYILHLWQENLPDYAQPVTIDADSVFIELRP